MEAGWQDEPKFQASYGVLIGTQFQLNNLIWVNFRGSQLATAVINSSSYWGDGYVRLRGGTRWNVPDHLE